MNFNMADGGAGELQLAPRRVRSREPGVEALEGLGILISGGLYGVTHQTY